ncbi:MAG TPA: phosphosulfolactate synthase [Chitinophagales bacterium]|nr:phosphosulfolactate synthase [Chitinophagales bacterium]HMU70259.1 phosphosulfolactate synthase [Chitinophagales bacterium]HMX05663.1 phosphosulfolactate synthase [Chitinophagales bacterium]HMZ89903.1 phosphosulfolactate synthase [Chitinophagales bacterium]HNA56567.1 phosphosulfolactate synthase [Chitinophagales bacterium]
MNFNLTRLPERTSKPRKEGLCMVMDKGLSVREAEDLLSVSEPYIDLIKLGFGTAFVTPNIENKIAVYKNAGIPTYFGGTLFEAFLVRGQFEDYLRLLEKYKMSYAEVSDGSIELNHDEKCGYINRLSKHVTVLSEVGSKDENKMIAPYKWIELMKKEIEAGSYKVIAEARESGTVGIYHSKGEVRSDLIDEILTQVPQDQIIWEAPLKGQQVYFIKLLGANVNLGNIPPNEVIPLETLRLGLRGDTFHHFLT